MAVHCSDGYWYRGVIKSIKIGCGSVKVFLVDTGKEIETIWTNIRSLVDKFVPMEYHVSFTHIHVFI